MSKKSNPPAAGASFKERKSTEFLGEQSVGTKRNEGLGLPNKEWMVSRREKDEHTPAPEYSEKQSGGRSKTHLRVPKSKQDGTESKPQGVGRPDSRPDNSHEKSVSGPRHPGKGPTGSSPRHCATKPVSSSPSGGPHPTAKKDSVNPRAYGNRSEVGKANVRRRSDVVPTDSSLISDENNSKKRTGNYGGISRSSLKDSK